MKMKKLPQYEITEINLTTWHYLMGSFLAADTNTRSSFTHQHMLQWRTVEYKQVQIPKIMWLFAPHQARMTLHLCVSTTVLINHHCLKDVIRLQWFLTDSSRERALSSIHHLLAVRKMPTTHSCTFVLDVPYQLQHEVGLFTTSAVKRLIWVVW